MAAVEAGYDLGVIALCVFALALLLATKGFVKAIAAPFEIAIPVIGKPFAGIATTIENGIVSWLDDAIRGVEKVTARFFSGLIDSLGILVGVTLIALILVKDALAYLWNQAVQPLIHTVVAPIRTLAEAAVAKVDALTGTVAADLTRAEHYAAGVASSATTDALNILRPEITAAEHAATRYADEAVAALRAAEDSAVGHVVALVAEAQAGGLAAAALAATEAEVVAAAALGQVETGATAALDAVKAIAIDLGHELDVITAGRDAAGVAALIASIPALATLVHVLATDTGLENADCRSKVKGICASDPHAWAGLLGAIATAGLLFDFKQIVHAATLLAAPVVELVKQAE